MHIVAIEGADRLGKQTQSERLLASLRQEGYDVHHFEVPWRDGDSSNTECSLYARIYDMLQNGQAMRHPVVFQSIHGCNRLVMQDYLIRLQNEGKLSSNSVLLMDRWTASTWVYGRETGLNDDQTAEILRGVWKPNLTLVLDGEPFHMEKAPDDYEKDESFQKRIRGQYRRWQIENATHSVLVNANRDIDEVAAEIRSLVFYYLRKNQVQHA